MLQSFLTVGQQIITLYLLLVVGFVLGKGEDTGRPCFHGHEQPCDVRGVPLHDDRGRFSGLWGGETLEFGLVTGVSLLLHVVFIAGGACC